jgi:hypothetical protein
LIAHPKDAEREELHDLTACERIADLPEDLLDQIGRLCPGEGQSSDKRRLRDLPW